MERVVELKDAPVPLLNNLEEVSDFDSGALSNRKPDRNISSILIEDSCCHILSKVNEELVKSANVVFLVGRERSVEPCHVSKAILVAAGIDDIDFRIGAGAKESLLEPVTMLEIEPSDSLL